MKPRKPLPDGARQRDTERTATNDADHQPSEADHGDGAGAPGNSDGKSSPIPTPTPAPAYGGIHHGMDVQRGLLVALVVMVGVFVFNYAQAVMIPTVTAVLIAMMFRPLTRSLELKGISAAFTSLLLIIVLTAILVVGVLLLAEPATQWVRAAPQTVERLEQRLNELKQPVEDVTEAAEQIDRLTEVGDDGGEFVQRVEVQPASVAGSVLTQTTTLLVGLTITLGLAFFLMAMGDALLRKIVEALPNLKEKRHAVEAFRQMESKVSNYLVLRTLINVGLALASGAIFWAVGLPNFIFWGVMAGLLNYIPYIGPVIVFVAVSAASLLMSDSWEWAMVGPLGFAVVNTIEAYVVTPLAFGRAYRLNPAVVFLWLVFWGWLWGIAGALLAVPMLICFRIMCDHNKALRPVGEFLGEE